MKNKRIILGILLSILSGILFFTAFPPLNIWPLMFIAFACTLIPQYRLFPAKWSHLAPTIANGVWLWPFLYRIFNIDGAPFWIKHIGLLVAIFIFFTSSERKFHELTGFRWFVLQGLSACVGFEMVRSFIPFFGTMGFTANPLAGQAWLIQPISIFSIYGLSLVVVLINLALAQLIMAWMDKKWPAEGTVAVNPKSVRNWGIGSVIVLAAWIALSLVIYNQQPGGTETVRVAALHMDLKDPGHQIDEVETQRRLELLADQVKEASGEGAEIIYVPEMAFGFDPQKEHTEEISSLAVNHEVFIYFTYAYHDESGWHNETVLISPDGSFSPIYGKQHAFGEPPTVSRGTFPINDTEYGKLGSIICMDGVFTDSARGTVSRGAQLLAIPTYNSTVGISEQNWTHFVMRSVENQVPVVNADRGLYSMITDSHGKILEDTQSPKGASDVVIADVPLADKESIYTMLGNDWLGYVCLAGFIFFVIYPSIVESRAKKSSRKNATA